MKLYMVMVSFLGFTAFAIPSRPLASAKLEPAPSIVFEGMVHDFGTLKEGDVVNCMFKFTNKGDAPLIVENVEEPCGCTVPSWSKAPVMPGQTGEIKVIFNSKERPGVFRKTLAVKTNAPEKKNEPLLLMIKGNVHQKTMERKVQNGIGPLGMDIA